MPTIFQNSSCSFPGSEDSDYQNSVGEQELYEGAFTEAGRSHKPLALCVRLCPPLVKSGGK